MREPEAGGHHQKAERQGEIVAAIELCGAHCRVQWRRDLEGQPSFLSSPVVSDGKVFVARGDMLLAYTADSAGRHVGRWEFNEFIAGTPVCAQDLVYLTTRKHVMAILLQ